MIKGGRKIMMSCLDSECGTPRFQTTGPIGATHSDLAMESTILWVYEGLYLDVVSCLISPCIGTDKMQVIRK